MLMAKKVIFFIESLSGGGAEKVLSTLVQHIDKSRFDVTVCAISGGGKYDEVVASNVKLIKIFDPVERYTGIKKLRYILKYNLIYKILPTWLVYNLFIPKGYDLEVAFVEGFATKVIAASSNKKAKKIAWVHVDLIQRPWPIELGVFKNLEDERSAYNCFDRIVCVSKSVEEIMCKSYGLKNTMTIYNPLDRDAILTQGKLQSSYDVDKNKFNIVSVGRYAKQKGYDLLLPVIARIRQIHSNVHLWLIGEGSERVALEQQAAELGILDNVTFSGFLKNPYALMSKMDLFVCSSRAEGFSLVIAESMILGVPVISMNCSGPNELLGKNEYGILCDTYEQLEEEIAAVIDGKKIPCSIPPMVDLQHTMNEVHHLLDS